ncbi:MAG: hypothetical protein KAR33_01465 [Candidatus Thorarchaeota archaeon]|nr:hypothetical protein [Candidatus Thorarchaeota archaeon]
MQKQIALGITVAVLCIVVVGFFILPIIIDLGRVPESDELWYTSGPYNLWENQTYSIYFRGANFTFCYIEDVPLDANIPAHFLITFSDAISEQLTIHLPGIVLFDDVFISNHTSPRAAVFTHGASDVLGKWFCAVSLS